MGEEVVHMSATELERLNILEAVRKKNLTQVKAAELLNISDRQVRNLLAILESEGVSGLVLRTHLTQFLLISFLVYPKKVPRFGGQG